MKIINDPDFKTSLGIASLILVHLLLSLFANIFFFIMQSKSFSNSKPIDIGFVGIELVAFLVCLVVLYVVIKISKMRETGLKIGFGFVYSLISTYFVVYKFVFEDYYHIKLIGGDWGYLAVILGWPVYFIVSIPLIIIFVKTFSKASITVSSVYSILMIMPTVFGVLMLLLLTFTGRAVYQPIYDNKKLQIEDELVITPVKVQFLGSNYDSQCSCTRPSVSGMIEVSNSLTFPVVLDLESSSSQSVCQIESKYSYLASRGNKQLSFKCSFSDIKPAQFNDYSKTTYILSIEELDNAGVRLEKPYSNKDFGEALNF